MGICYPRKTMAHFRKFAVGGAFAAVVAWVALAGTLMLQAQQSTTPAPTAPSSPARAAKPGSGVSNAEFAAAADEVLHQMSEITELKLLTPLKKSLRSREQIRAYMINEMKEDKDIA